MKQQTTNSGNKNKNLPLIIVMSLLAIVLIVMIVVALGRRIDFPQDTSQNTDTGYEPDDGTEDGYLEKWQEGIIQHNGKYYQFNNDINVYLFMGIDKDGKVETAPDSVSGGQSDAMFLLVTNSDDQTLSVVSINRNSMTQIQVYSESGLSLGTANAQICTQHGFGDGKKLSCSRTVDAVSYLFYNLPIDGYLSINMGAIPIMNDSVGGIEVTVLDDLYYPSAGVDLKKGETVTLEGMEAYYYLRGRDTGTFDSATNRLRRQEQFITSYFAKLTEIAKGSTSKVLSVYEAIEDYVVTNIDFVDMISELMAYEYDESRLYTVPGETVMGEKHEEYYVDDDALYDLIVQVFYEEVNPNN